MILITGNAFLGIGKKLLTTEYTDLQSQFRSSITHFSAIVAMKLKNFEQIFVLIQANTTCQAADANNKVRYFTHALVLKIFKLVLYLNYTVINNQIRHYFTTIRTNFQDTKYGFQYANSLWFVAGRLKNIYQELKKIKAGNVTVSNIVVQGRQSFATASNLSNNQLLLTSSLFSLTGKSEIVYAQNFDKDCYLTSQYLHSHKACHLKIL